jgi:uncharacterized protein YwgA
MDIKLSDLLLITLDAFLETTKENELRGRTFFQKTVYFVSQYFNVNTSYRAGLYGPYSYKVAYAIEELCTLNFIHEEVIPLPSGYLYIYTLTDDGKTICNELRNSRQKEYEIVRKMIQTIPHEQEKLITAAKVHYITKVMAAKETDDVINRARSVGWDLMKNEVEEALKYIRELEKIKDV